MGTFNVGVWKIRENEEERIELSFELFAKAHSHINYKHVYIPVHIHTNASSLDEQKSIGY